jgi:hypothetical protein
MRRRLNRLKLNGDDFRGLTEIGAEVLLDPRQRRFTCLFLNYYLRPITNTGNVFILFFF